MVKCSIRLGKYCNEPFCHYIYHQSEAEKWLRIWKNKLDAELIDYKRRELIEKKLVIHSPEKEEFVGAKEDD